MIDFKVVPDGGEPYEVTATSRDVLVWERTSKGRSMSQLKDNLRIEDMYRLAHIASRRLGLFNGDLATFEQTCELNFEDEEEDEVFPTKPAPSTGSPSS